MEIEYCNTIENVNHPQVLYWFWTPDMIEDKTYIEELENIYHTMSFDLLFLTSRDGLSFFDYEQVAIPFKETVEKAHELNIKIGLQLWRNAEAAELEDALALIVEGEDRLDDDGMLFYEAETQGHRGQESLKTELFKVVLFKKTGEGTYEDGSLMDVTDTCEILYTDNEKIKISIAAGTEYARYTAYILTAHYHRSPDLFSQCSINSFSTAMDTYAAIPFDGIGLDEFKSMPITPPWVAMWHPYRQRIYGRAFSRYFNEQTGMDLKQVILEMRYVPEHQQSIRMKAINYYFDVLKDGPIRVENFVYDYAKNVYGEDTFIGLHNTYHNKLTNDEIWETGCMWWDLPREYGHTDEDIAYPVRMGIGYSHPKPIIYDMYYTEGKQIPIYKKAIVDARYNCRVHYHAYNDRRPNRFDMKNPEFSTTIAQIERKIKLLNHFDGPLPKLDLLVVFGRPALANWFPHYEHRNEYDINGSMLAIEKCEALWNAGVMCGLLPSNKIEQGDLCINDNQQIEYKGHTFDSILYLSPEYSKESTLDFLEECSNTGNRLMIEGYATHDFDGNDCKEQFSRISQKAEMIDFSVETIINTGVKINTISQGCILEDGSVIMTDLNSILYEKPLEFSVPINGYVFKGSYIGTMAIKATENGRVEKFVCGGFKELLRDGEKIISLNTIADTILLESDGDYKVTIEGIESDVKIDISQNLS